MKKFGYIDCLRGLAVLAVVFVHTEAYGIFDKLPEAIKTLISQGANGVQLFFVASAFTLFLSFNNRNKLETFPVRNFFLRRFFRIAPMYYIGILYYLFQNGSGPRAWLGTDTSITEANIISNFLFLHGFYPNWMNSLVPGGWSIAVEMMFYAMLPFLFVRIRNINQAVWFFIITILLMAILTGLFYSLHFTGNEFVLSTYLSKFYLPAELPVFALGILLYFIIIEKAKFSEIAPFPMLILAFLLIAQVATVNLSIWLFFPTHILFAISFVLLAVALSRMDFILLNNLVIRYIGKVSYSMYLVHFAVIHWLLHFRLLKLAGNGIPGFAIGFIIVTVVSVLISTVTYRLIELPFQRFCSRFIDKLAMRYKTANKSGLQ